MEYDGKGVWNHKGKAIRVEGRVATDTTHVNNSRRERSLTSSAKKFRTFKLGPYQKSRKGSR